MGCLRAVYLSVAISRQLLQPSQPAHLPAPFGLALLVRLRSQVRKLGGVQLRRLRTASGRWQFLLAQHQAVQRPVK